MTDILTRLAALTQMGDDNPSPCPFCATAPCKDPQNTYMTNKKKVWCMYCDAEGPEHDTEQGAVALWNTRPREAALIALVQEAAEEIARLNTKIAAREWAIGVKDKQIMELSDIIDHQEDAHG
jgi:hypothetical protein